VNCHACPAPAGFLEPVPTEPGVSRPVCAAHKGAGAIPVDPGDMAALYLFGPGGEDGDA
jgi:hypothetical protein